MTDQPFRKLSAPYMIEHPSERTQALEGLRMFGPMSTNALAVSLGVGLETLRTLEREGLVESKENRQRTLFWRLKESS